MGIFDWLLGKKSKDDGEALRAAANMELKSWRRRFQDKVNQEFEYRKAAQVKLQEEVKKVATQRRRLVKDLRPQIKRTCNEFARIVKWKVFDWSYERAIKFSLGVEHHYESGYSTSLEVSTWPDDENFKAPLSLYPKLKELKGTEDWLPKILGDERGTWGNPQQYYPIQGITVIPELFIDVDVFQFFPGIKLYFEGQGFVSSGLYYLRHDQPGFRHVHICHFTVLHDFTPVQLARVLENMYKAWRNYIKRKCLIPNRRLIPNY